MTRCARCDWHGDDQDALIAHAQASGHWLCDCQRSLARHEPRICTRCVAKVRADLADIESLYVRLLAAELGYAPSSGPTDSPHSNDTTLPGGDMLAMRGPGSHGNAHSTRNGHDRNDGEIPGVTIHPDDPIPVEWAIASWEDVIRAEHHDPAAGAVYLTASVAYLGRRLQWVADTLPEFTELARDVAEVRQALDRAVGNGPTIYGDATCLDCGSRLVAHFHAPIIDRTKQVHYGGGRDFDRAGNALWYCRRCKRTISDLELRLAVRTWVEDRANGGVA